MNKAEIMEVLVHVFYETDGQVYWGYMDHLPMDECLGEEVNAALLQLVRECKGKLRNE